MKTLQRTALAAASTLLALLAAPSAHAWQASLTVLDPVSSSDEELCGATSISDDGQIVGGYTRTMRSADGRAGALWPNGPVAREVRGFQTKNLWGHVRALTPSGAIVVGSATLANEPQAFKWTVGTGTQMLERPPGFRGGEALALSSDGSVVVGYGNYDASVWGRPVHMTEAVVWNNGQPTPLGFLNNGLSSKAFDVTPDGSVIVGESWTDSNIGEHLAVAWVNGVGPIEIGDLPGGYDRSRAVAVSDDGNTVAGWGTTVFNPYLHRIFRWTRTGGMVDLGFPTGYFLAEATAMTPDGSVIVGWGEKPASANRAPVIWDALNGTRDLILVLEAAGVDVSAWRDTAGNTFMQATGI
ncbi:MAG: putative membrane protein, partial [Planctomycetota bacterium]